MRGRRGKNDGVTGSTLRQIAQCGWGDGEKERQNDRETGRLGERAKKKCLKICNPCPEPFVEGCNLKSLH
jgi:hypothetical protein